MRHSVYCDCTRCNGAPTPTRTKARQQHYANGTAPAPRRLAPPPLTQGISDESLKALREHFTQR